MGDDKGIIRNAVAKGWILVLGSIVILFGIVVFIPLERVEGVIGIRILLTIGIVLGFLAGISVTRSLACFEDTSSCNRWEIIASGLEGDEKKLYLDLLRFGGAILQNDLCIESDFSRSKVCRLLAKMEVRGLLERRRSGMTNLVVLH